MCPVGFGIACTEALTLVLRQLVGSGCELLSVKYRDPARKSALDALLPEASEASASRFGEVGEIFTGLLNVARMVNSKRLPLVCHMGSPISFPA
jgi:hypothetical protein